MENAISFKIVTPVAATSGRRSAEAKATLLKIQYAKDIALESGGTVLVPWPELGDFLSPEDHLLRSVRGKSTLVFRPDGEIVLDIGIADFVLLPAIQSDKTTDSNAPSANRT
ncbi:MAG: hypothetical protein ACFUZC_14845 [Chthoniobacteraceae bacterium]